MSSSTALAAPTGMAERLVLPVFVATLLGSAFLLFSVQPLFGKLVLPILGGSPGVWTVATVVFQTLLLCGYAYAHWLAARPIRTAAIVHLGLMAGAAASLPTGIGSGWRVPPPGEEALWLVGVSSTAIGLPFVAVAANGPLLQAWFSRGRHRGAGDPYFLYAASNMGSFLALAAYPVLLEPNLSLRGQSLAWAGGFALLAVGIALCAFLVCAARDRDCAPSASSEPAATAPTWRERGSWIALSAVPSGLVVAVTAHISTDVAAVPLLWLLPLALFLLSFVLAFRPWRRPPLQVLGFAQAGGTVLAIVGLGTENPLWIGLGLHLGLFALNCTLCQRRLYEARPSAAHLTDFYLCIAAGGAAGGMACGLLAPLVFSGVLEYPVLLAAVLLCRPSEGAAKIPSRRELVRLLVGSALVLLAAVIAERIGLSGAIIRRLAVLIFATALLLTWRRPVSAAALALIAGLSALLLPSGMPIEATVRSFFGVHKVLVSPDGRFRLLAHGTTIHGAMRIREEDGAPTAGRPEPTTYYTYEGAIGRAIESVRAARGGSLGAVSVVGLGVGSLACHAHSGESWTFYEIDREVVVIASNPSLFRFLSGCGPKPHVVLGDARLTLAEGPRGQDILIIDAFSSDSIPLHLLTREALDLYLTRLGPEGALVIHVSNRHLDLTRILARTGAEAGLSAWMRFDRFDQTPQNRMRSAEIVVALARRPEDLGRIAADSEWQRLEPELSRRPWTDDYSNIVEALIDKAVP